MKEAAMASSFRSVNYSLRPAKAVERKMLCDLFRRLEPFGRIDTFRYIGFGSIYFTDFQLFHQTLGISDMVSIEKEETNWPRFEFNLPFRCVDLMHGHSNSVLPKLDWNKRSLVWLDYDGKLNKEVLADLATFCSKAISGSTIFVTINAEPDRAAVGTAPKDQDAFRLKAFADAVGDEKIPLGLTGDALRGAGYAAACRGVIDSEIRLQLNARNGPSADENKFNYQQLINFHYADDAQMLTVGGLLHEHRHNPEVKACGMDELPFVCKGASALTIKAPKLTQKEIRFLNSQLPHRSVDTVSLPGVPAYDVGEYAKIYRYYPSFGEVLLG
jgi:hypothetical protein